MSSHSREKIITLSFILFGGFVTLSVRVLFTALATSSVFLSRLYAEDIVQHGIPVFLGLLTFFLLQFNKKTNIWANEVLSEVTSIVWPSRRDTIMMSAVCCVMLLISGVLLGVFDFLSSHIIRLILD